MNRIISLAFVLMLAGGSIVGTLGQRAAAASSLLPPVMSPGARYQSDGSEENVLTIGFYANVTSIDPATACSTEDAKITTQLYDRLVGHGVKTLEDGTLISDDEVIEPRLAESWDVSDDGKTYTFHLTEGAVFPSGAPVNAEAVIYSFDRMLTMNQCGVYAFSVGVPGNIASMEAIDDLTVQVTLEQADPLFLSGLAKGTAGIVDKTVVDEHGGVIEGERNEWMNTNSAGGGPYIVERFAPGEEIVLRANETYRGGKPYYDRVVYQIITDPANRVLLTERGDIQLAYNIPFRDQLRLAENENLEIIRQPGLKLTFIGLNNATEPFNNPLVREALAYAVPYDDIIAQVTSGLATPMKSMVPPLMANYDPSFFEPTTDLERARQLLAEAGYPNGFNFTLDIQAGSQEFDDIAIILQAQLSQIGINMEVRKLDLAKYYEIVRGGETQAYLIARTTGVNDPGYFLGYMLPCGSTFQYSAYCNEEVDALLQQARFEPDPDVRAELYSEIQRLHAADFADLWLYVNPDTVVLNDSVEGFVYYPTLQEELVALHGSE